MCPSIIQELNIMTKVKNVAIMPPLVSCLPDNIIICVKYCFSYCVLPSQFCVFYTTWNSYVNSPEQGKKSCFGEIFNELGRGQCYIDPSTVLTKYKLQRFKTEEEHHALHRRHQV